MLKLNALFVKFEISKSFSRLELYREIEIINVLISHFYDIFPDFFSEFLADIHVGYRYKNMSL